MKQPILTCLSSAMKAKPRRALFSVLLAAVLTLGVFSFVPAAHAASVAPATATSSPCQSLLVHLNGTQPATATCLVKSGTGQVNPAISERSCTASNVKAVWIYESINKGGACIGFIGSGWTNMSNWEWCDPSGIFCINWNDEASSFYTGCSPVYFFVDANGKGRQAHASAYVFSNFPYGGVGNDQLSSIHITTNC